MTRKTLIPACFLAGMLWIPASGECASTRELGAIPLPARPSAGRVELEVWNDPDFRRRFAESYMAETDIEPRVTEEEREVMQEVLELISAEDYGAAMRELEKIQSEASSAVVDFTLGNLYFQRDELPRAAAAYQKAVDKHAKYRRAWQNLGLIHVRGGDFEQGIEALTKVIELGGGDSRTYGLLGFAYASLDNSISAESAYRMAILLDGKTMDWKMGLARAFFRQERYGEAISLCAHLLKDHPDRADLWLLQANAYVGMNQPMEAAKNFELVERMGQSTADSLNLLGDIYINDELFGLAVNAYASAMKKDTGATVDRPLRSAKVLAAHGAFDETSRLLGEIESQRGGTLSEEQRKELLKLRARLAVADGSGEEEARVLEEIVELDPLDGEALILLGQHAQRGGDSEQAAFYFERAAAIEDFEADAKLRHAQMLVVEKKYAEALPLLRRAQQINYRENVQEFLEGVERAAK